MITVLVVPSPLGPLRVVADADAVTGVYLPRQPGPAGLAALPAPPALSPARTLADELEAYFAGRLRVFQTPLRTDGTAFQAAVWQALQSIGYAQTTSYGVLAAQLRRPDAARAVGAAIGRNPLSIVIPCHRVLGASGTLTGYAGGLDAKQWLLAHEAASRPPE